MILQLVSFWEDKKLWQPFSLQYQTSSPPFVPWTHYISTFMTIPIMDSIMWLYLSSVQNSDRGVMPDSRDTPPTTPAQWRENITLSNGRYGACSSSLTQSASPSVLAKSRAVFPYYKNKKNKELKFYLDKCLKIINNKKIIDIKIFYMF